MGVSRASPLSVAVEVPTGLARKQQDHRLAAYKSIGCNSRILRNHRTRGCPDWAADTTPPMLSKWNRLMRRTRVYLATMRWPIRARDWGTPKCAPAWRVNNSPPGANRPGSSFAVWRRRAHQPTPCSRAAVRLHHPPTTPVPGRSPARRIARPWTFTRLADGRSVARGGIIILIVCTPPCGVIRSCGPPAST